MELKLHNYSVYTTYKNKTADKLHISCCDFNYTFNEGVYYFNGMYVSFSYKNSDAEHLMGYDTSRKTIDYDKVNLQNDYDVAFTTDDGCPVYRTKLNSYYYQ